jgi:glycosyltransferase involved in cell wall biosynthesis
VLLPTRNGASILAGCVESILNQPYADFELVISNNASADGTDEILARYASDPRVRLVRQDEPLDVTGNWSAALAASTGDHIVLIGDDDLMLPGYFERTDALLEEHGNPDVLMYDAYHYAYPGIDGTSVGHFTRSAFEALDLPNWGELSLVERHERVRKLFAFDFCFPLGVQLMLVARRAIERFPGAFFKPPFPDGYAAAGLLLSAARWVIAPENLVVVGTSPKSFGHASLSSEDNDVGSNYLGIDPRFDGMLPGSVFFNAMWESLVVLKRDFPAELAGVEPDRCAYVLFQAYIWYHQRRRGSLSSGELVDRLRLLDLGDWLGLPRVILRKLDLSKLRRQLSVQSDSADATLGPELLPAPGTSNIVEFADWIRAVEPAPVAAVAARS